MTDAAVLRTGSSSAARAAALPRYPSLIEINTRAWLCRLSCEAGRPITLEVDDATLDELARRGFVWLLSVWRTGVASRARSRRNAAWRAEFQAVLPDLTEEDTSGSGFAISAYARSPENYNRVETDHGPRMLARGRDPNFPGWPDTLQLN